MVFLDGENLLTASADKAAAGKAPTQPQQWLVAVTREMVLQDQEVAVAVADSRLQRLLSAVTEGMDK
jgi:hypothetical protein